MIKLYVMDGVDEIQYFDLPGDTVCVGRSSENQIKMKDGYVSGSHLKIIEKGDRYFVQDGEYQRHLCQRTSHSAGR